MTQRILLVDGMALLFRGYFATAYSGNFMKTKDGVPTNGVYQFLRYFLDGINAFEPTHVICCWDMGSKTFRTDLYVDYKANRSEPPAELIPQFPLVREAVDAFGIPNIGMERYEADDVIGSLAKQYAADFEVVIQTGDYDMLQLVDENINVAIMKKGIGNYDVFNQANFFEKKGLNPNQIIDFKGLIGDSADNYPGIKGIGEKTATTLIQKYHDFVGILAAIDDLTPGIRKKIKQDEQMFYLSKQLAEIKCDLAIDLNIEQAKLAYLPENVFKKLSELSLRLGSIKNLI